MADEPKMTFQEFETATREEGHPLYAGFSGEALSNFREYVYHSLSAAVTPEVIYSMGEDLANPLKVAQRTKKEWHGLYADALKKFLGI